METRASVPTPGDNQSHWFPAVLRPREATSLGKVGRRPFPRYFAFPDDRPKEGGNQDGDSARTRAYPAPDVADRTHIDLPVDIAGDEDDEHYSDGKSEAGTS